LYKLGATWVPAEKKGRYVNLKSTPKLPQWALPAGYKGEVGENYSATTLGDEEPEEAQEAIEYTKEELEKAKAMVVPDMGIPFKGKTLEEASKDESTGKFVVQYLTGKFKAKSGMMFKPITDEEKALQRAAQIVFDALDE
jgi:methionine aminopeptidase